MGTTLWIQTLVEREMSDESDDHSLMYDLAEELDAACDDLGLARLSSFFDSTDFDFNMSDEFDDDEFEHSVEPDAESGLPYGIDDMEWFAATAGIACLTELRGHVAAGWKPELDEDDRAVLVEELDNCLETLKALPPENGKFHLAIIM